LFSDLSRLGFVHFENEIFLKKKRSISFKTRRRAYFNSLMNIVYLLSIKNFISI